MNQHGYKKVLIFGSGPITIGQACEFDYSGTQACKALKEEGIEVILLNSNPATIMTDPGVADRTYIEPIHSSMVLQIIRKEGVDAILPTMGGQTALNLIMTLSKIKGALDGVDVIGANLRSIHLAEDRRAFRELVGSMGLDSPRAKVVRSVEETKEFAKDIGFPFILRPSFTLGGYGQSMVMGPEELLDKTTRAIDASPIAEVLVEESVLGWKEYELEVMRDRQDNAIVVCSIENLDPMGVHTGDSITVAPQQTLTDREYQAMRTDALALVRRVGVETGGCNVQFAVEPKTGRRTVIEMNPRVSRSSALASKATGFPIAYVATKLALGYSLSDIENTVTQSTKACFEPPIDYVALKIPRWHFEKFPGAKDSLSPQMQSVGEVLALGGCLAEAFHKAVNSLERKWPRFRPVDASNPLEAWREQKQELLASAHSKRAFAIWDALCAGMAVDELAECTGWDSWFLQELKIYIEENSLKARATSLIEKPTRFEMIDTCSGEYPVATPFYYSTRESYSFTPPEGSVEEKPLLLEEGLKGRVVVLGSGPNRIGQGVEFDYCCVRSCLALRKHGYESIMINCNPETVSTDPTTSTRLYLEPLHADVVKEILMRELDPVKAQGKAAFVVVQMGGQTPLKLAQQIKDWGYNILGTEPEDIDLCEDRQRFADFLKDNNIRYPEFTSAANIDEALKRCRALGFPVLVRPSYVLGGRGMKICSTERQVKEAFEEAKQVSEEYPLYIDRFLADAVEFDIDGISDGEKAWVAGVMEHVEETGIHSGDSSCVIPPFRLPPSKIDELAGIAKTIALGTRAKGLFNIQLAVHGEEIYVIEANPRASRTVPYLAKSTGYPVIEWGLRAALGEKISEIVKNEANIPGNYRLPTHGYSVKVPVFPFEKFQHVDPVLGPEMRSTGEVMGIGQSAGEAYAKAMLSTGVELPTKGTLLVSVRDSDKTKMLSIVRSFEMLGFDILGTPGSAEYLRRAGLDCKDVPKIGKAPLGEDLLAILQSGKVSLLINTTEPKTASTLRDGESIRQVALRCRVPLLSTLSKAEMTLMAIQTLKKGSLESICLQDFVGEKS